MLKNRRKASKPRFASAFYITKFCFKRVFIEVFIASEADRRNFSQGDLHQVFNNLELGKMVRDVGSSVNRYTIMVILVYDYIVYQCCYFFCGACWKSYLWNKIVR